MKKSGERVHWSELGFIRFLYNGGFLCFLFSSSLSPILAYIGHHSSFTHVHSMITDQFGYEFCGVEEDT